VIFLPAWDNIEVAEPNERTRSKVSSVQVGVSLSTRRPRIALSLSSVQPVATSRPFILVCSVRQSGGNAYFGFRLLWPRSTWCLFGLVFASIPIFFFVVFWKMHFAPPKLEPSTTPLDTNVLGLNQ